MGVKLLVVVGVSDKVDVMDDVVVVVGDDMEMAVQV